MPIKPRSCTSHASATKRRLNRAAVAAEETRAVAAGDPPPPRSRSNRMELTAETLLEVLRSLRCDPTSSAMRRRRLPRVGVRLRLKILPFREGPGNGPRMPQPAVVRLRDLSRRGLGFVHS